MEKRFVAYYRVSTKQQTTGLSIEGQRHAVQTFAGSDSIVAEYTETASGKSKDRPELLKAVAHAKRAKAVLLVAKLDRLARNVAFTSALMESGVDFVACDNPSDSRLTLHIMAAMAEDEARQISERTKAALDAVKRSGKKLGSAREGHWDGREHLRTKGLAKARVAAAKAHRTAFIDDYRDTYPLIKTLRDAGKTLDQIADTLNRKGLLTRRGKAFQSVHILRIIEKFTDTENATPGITESIKPASAQKTLAFMEPPKDVVRAGRV